MNYPSKLTAEEWNLLTKLTEKNGMDCWFTLCNDSEKDMVFDTENRVKIKLRDGIKQVAEGVTRESLEEIDGIKDWNFLMDEYGLGEFKFT